MIQIQNSSAYSACIIGMLTVAAIATSIVLAVRHQAGKTATVPDLKFPLVLVRGGSTPWVETDVVNWRTMRIDSSRAPTSDTVIIDSDLNLYTPQNIRSDAGSAGMLFRAFVRPGRPVTYTFDLKRCLQSGIEAARERLAVCESLDVDPGKSAQKKRELSLARNLQEIINILGSGL